MIDMTGQKFGRLTALEYIGSSLWLFRCDCGKEKVIPGYDARHGRIRSCGCLLSEMVYNKNISGKPLGESAHTQIYLTYLHGAMMRKYEFNLSPEFVREITQKLCFYCGASPNNTKKNRFGRGDIVYNGIDRIDNSVGYNEGNVVPCCKKCNMAKGTKSQKEFLEWVDAIYNNFHSKCHFTK